MIQVDRKLHDTVEELFNVAAGMRYGEFSYHYDSMVTEEDPPRVLEELASTLADYAYGRQPAPTTAIKGLCDALEVYKNQYNVRELYKPIQELKEYIAGRK